MREFWAICSSSRLRSCMTFWLFSGLDQKSGALISSSDFASWDRLPGASKIAPHSFSLLAERKVLAVEFVEGHLVLIVTAATSTCLHSMLHNAMLLLDSIMRTHDTDRVRNFATQQYIEPAKKRGESRVRITAGDVHRALRLHNRIPLVCSALRSGEFLRRNHLRLESQEGPPSMMSTTVTFTYAIEDHSKPAAQADLFYQLRGISKDTYGDVGGGQAFLQAERERFDRGVQERETA